MQLARKILKRFNGFHYPQEYLCMPATNPELKLYLFLHGILIADITSYHCFTGYHPLIIALPSTIHKKLQETNEIELLFSPHPYIDNVEVIRKDAPATLIMQKLKFVTLDGTGILFYKGNKGVHHFTGMIQQYMGQLENHFFARKPGNVFLKGNLLKQVQIAYSIPRNISVATSGNENRINFFPTDLHGPVGTRKYIVSLRHEGLACKQVMEAGQMVLAQVDAQAYRKVYALGKNHMKELQPFEVFETMGQTSKRLNLPLHTDSVSYRELILEDSFICGIHRLMLFSVIHHEVIHPHIPSLQHIHNCSATWQWKQGREGNYLVR